MLLSTIRTGREREGFINFFGIRILLLLIKAEFNIEIT